MKLRCRWRNGLVALLVAFAGVAATNGEALESHYRSPPNAAKPGIWWYWGESVTTERDRTQDLEALQRVGCGDRVGMCGRTARRCGAAAGEEWRHEFLRGFDARLKGSLRFGSGEKNNDNAPNWLTTKDAVVGPVRVNETTTFELSLKIER